MLMSLDQFSSTQTTSSGSNAHDAPQYEDDDDSPRFFDIPRYRSNNNITAQANNWQQGHGPSYSSDMDADDASRPSNQISRGRRSNSSTTHNEAYARLNSGRPPPSRSNHARGGRGSKSSSITSLEQPQASSAKLRHAPNRSASFDNSLPQSKLQVYPQLEDVPQSPFRSDFINSFLTEDFDAAPTPTIPGGPRREPSGLEDRPRNRSTSRSVKSSSGRGKAQTREPAPPMPSKAAAIMDLDAAPAPNVGYGKSKEPPASSSAQSPSAPTAAAAPKEKPGFFKRVFGGGFGGGSSSPDPVQQPTTGSTPPSRDRDMPSSHSNHPPLQKKSSSFFRRRKKSVADETAPASDAPPVPPIAAANLNLQNVAPSPAGSLRQAMDPYLHEAPGTPAEKKQHPEYQREFSPDYEPSPNARIRKVPSLELDTPSKTPTRDNSFLDLDCGSDNEVLTPKVKKSKDDTIRPRKKKSSRRLPIQNIQTGNSSSLSLPKEGTKGSASPRSPASIAPDVKIDGPMGELDEPIFVIGEPTEDDRQKAQQIYDGNEDFISQEKAAAWMGEEGPIRQRTLQAYMELYDFVDKSIVWSLRQVCLRLVFRAETQQMDRILVAFSKRWCHCNPNHGFKATDVIHTICYSIMLLNTDLHMADIEQNMTRSQFVKNTMGTITQAVLEAAPDAFERRPSILADKNSMLSPDEPSTPTPTEERKSFRNSFRPPPRIDSQGVMEGVEDCGPLVKSPHHGSQKSWEELVELVLKGIYSSIRDEKLPLFGADPTKPMAAPPAQLSVMGMLKRTPSVLSKAPSEGNLSSRGRVTESRGTASRWTSKSRSRPGLGRNGFNSSRTSFEDGSSIWSPNLSSATWSRQSLGRTQASASQDSFGSAMPRGDYQASIGFANALSQAIIRDEEAYGDGSPSVLSADLSATQLLEDESLELMGPPWMKEGLVIHKHHLDGVDKKARERNWSEVFVVIQKGQMSLFSFTSTKSQRQKSRSRAAGPVGGGNWQDNATTVGSFSLRQTLASALPPPGYSRTRPHVWALSLPTGAVHLFQVGTPELIKEFVTTANYWSARQSTHPLVGGISNIEYGWSGAIVNNALVSAINEPRPPRPGSSAAHGRKSSVSSFRSASIDQATAAFTHATGRGKLPGDRIHISDWTPPSQSLRPSNAGEADQLATLQAYVKSIEDDLQAHNQLRSPMLLAFTPRGHNAIKAMANWERKSAYLLREIVKFRTYVDCLQQADTRKQQVYAERDLAHRAARGELSDGDMDVSGGEEEHEEDEAADDTLRA
ncbi:uncharacterized protein F5Z01DRAFT_628124 [Emericellopsis atlantica]|uniref:SEC7 domain-containing protein n=1 Tax=Emericellopsis atlantica TaxID=2614577 RepID=A0A9P7ZFJ9_9HYPO|nr:uncharacterized protein F5Z01DRAFT_628124 [Emericellopsis atlantica]KAG9251198.1 hypothetical protein F5Z01DRAFT_628124 [Emericellopsis atlantica]